MGSARALACRFPRPRGKPRAHRKVPKIRQGGTAKGLDARRVQQHPRGGCAPQLRFFAFISAIATGWARHTEFTRQARPRSTRNENLNSYRLPTLSVATTREARPRVDCGLR